MNVLEDEVSYNLKPVTSYELGQFLIGMGPFVTKKSDFSLKYFCKLHILLFSLDTFRYFVNYFSFHIFLNLLIYRTLLFFYWH